MGHAVLRANGHAANSGRTVKDISPSESIGGASPFLGGRAMGAVEDYTAGRNCYKTTNARHYLLQHPFTLPLSFL
jgi:hypothetical protein